MFGLWFVCDNVAPLAQYQPKTISRLCCRVFSGRVVVGQGWVWQDCEVVARQTAAGQRCSSRTGTHRSVDPWHRPVASSASPATSLPALPRSASQGERWSRSRELRESRCRPPTCELSLGVDPAAEIASKQTRNTMHSSSRRAITFSNVIATRIVVLVQAASIQWSLLAT